MVDALVGLVNAHLATPPEPVDSRAEARFGRAGPPRAPGGQPDPLHRRGQRLPPHSGRARGRRGPAGRPAGHRPTAIADRPMGVPQVHRSWVQARLGQLTGLAPGRPPPGQDRVPEAPGRGAAAHPPPGCSGRAPRRDHRAPEMRQPPGGCPGGCLPTVGCGGLDLNQRPLGYELPRVLSAVVVGFPRWSGIVSPGGYLPVARLPRWSV
jgi:hypothetical protein